MPARMKANRIFSDTSVERFIHSVRKSYDGAE